MRLSLTKEMLMRVWNRNPINCPDIVSLENEIYQNTLIVYDTPE